MLHPRALPDLETSIQLAAVQLNSAGDWPTNRQRVQEAVAAAAAAGAQLVVLPEYFVLMHPDEQARFALAEEDGQGPIQDFLAQLAAQQGVWLVAGSLPLKTPFADKLTNSCLVYGPAGERVGRYDKVHLFSFQRGQERYDEAATQLAGERPLIFDTPFGRVGVGICYDLRFPEFFRHLDAVDLWVLPAAFTVTTGQAHWEVLLRARAIENQCYFLAAAQTGTHQGGRQTYGHSLLVDPWGEVVAQLDDQPGLLLGSLEPQRLAEVRTQLPALLHRRLGV
ncbi:carbon-nitrogen hydrolase family protein [Marinospirillum sp. MEB164]|uniref:Carbon-nitrogen hydrolase family protein n=1 Tax=Marinospirillum alkalitolerans TaxID=3123374 RepID=A0ABW8PY55_9GAMM